jgi:hypothetical protein
VGVFLAFLLDRIIEREKERETKKELLRNFSHELNRIKGELNEEANLLYPDIYESALTSGRLNLLNTEQITKITNVYGKIREQEHEAMRLRDAKEVYEQTKSKKVELAWLELRVENIHREKDIIKTIEEVMKENWLSCSKR